MNNYSFCAISKDVDVATCEIFDVVCYGTGPGGAAYRGFVAEGRNPGTDPSGGSQMTDITMLTAEVTWQLRGSQIDEFHNCYGDTYGSTVFGGLGWDIGAGCYNLRFSNLWGAYTNGQSAPGTGVKISGNCTGIIINGLYTADNVAADLSVDNTCTVFVDVMTWGESRVFAGNGTINNALPTPLGGAPGKETLRINSAGAGQVNRFEMTGNIAGFGLVLEAAGTDSNIPIYIAAKGVGPIVFQSNSGGAAAAILSVSGPTNAANSVGIFASAAGGICGLNTSGGHLALTSSTGLIAFASPASSSPNGAVATALGSVGPAGAHGSPQEWLTVVTPSGATRYIPCF